MQPRDAGFLDPRPKEAVTLCEVWGVGGIPGLWAIQQKATVLYSLIGDTEMALDFLVFPTHPMSKTQNVQKLLSLNH